MFDVRPSLPSYMCRGDDWRYPDPNIHAIGGTGGQYANGTVPLSYDGGNALPGVVGERVCVTFFSKYKKQDPTCVAMAPILGQDPASCPLIEFFDEGIVTSSLVTVAAPPAPPAQVTPLAPPAGAPSAPCSKLHGKKLKRCNALRKCAKIKRAAR